MDLSNLNINDSGEEESIVQSERRNDQLNDVLTQHLGSSWKITAFLIIIFIFGCVVLVIYGFGSTDTQPNTQTQITSTTNTVIGGTGTGTGGTNPVNTPSTMSKMLTFLSDTIKPHLKIMLIMLIVSIVLFSIWTLIKPNSPDVTIQGVVPFPSNTPQIPPDSTRCGTSIVNCTTTNKDCSVCQEKSGINNYVCTPILPDKKVYYEGSPLEPGQNYCLPKEAEKVINGCGTYTGKTVFSSSNGEGWQCQCLYPDIFYDDNNTSGQTCTQQQVCKTLDGTTSLLTDKNGNKWDPAHMPAALNGTTPYDIDKTTGKPVFSCSPTPGYNTYPNDPFELHKDKCYVGSTSTTGSGIFDMTSMECVCDCGEGSDQFYNTQRGTYKSNISGFCYPYGEGVKDICKPHYITGLCTFDFDPISVPTATRTNTILFNWNGKTYIPYIYTIPTGTNISANCYKPPVPAVPLQYVCLVDITGNSLISGTPFDVTNTAAADLFLPFPIKSFSELPSAMQQEINTIIPKINLTQTEANINSTIDGVNPPLPNYVPGYARQCSSYFYNRGSGNKCLDPLNKTGIEYIPICKGQNGGDANSTCGVYSSGSSKGSNIGQCHADISSTISGLENKYKCICPNGYAFIDGKCQNCLPDGEIRPDNSTESAQSCCSQWISSYTYTKGGGNLAQCASGYHCSPYGTASQDCSSSYCPDGFKCVPGSVSYCATCQKI
jgi:hypothetical protein